MGNLLLSGVEVDISGFCSNAADILQFVGWILTFVKISIPLLIIGLGIFDLGKAVVASKDDEIKKATKQLLYRALSGVIIFFIPTIVLWLFGAINTFSTAADEADFDVCKTCVLTPWDSSCNSTSSDSDY